MAYVKNTWAKGDIITASKLNHMEDGISAGGSGIKVYNIDIHITENTVEGGYDNFSGTIETNLSNVTSKQTLWAAVKSAILAQDPCIFKVTAFYEVADGRHDPVYSFMGFGAITGDADLITIGTYIQNAESGVNRNYWMFGSDGEYWADALYISNIFFWSDNYTFAQS